MLASPTKPIKAGDSLTDLPHLLQASEGWNELIQALSARQSGTIDGAWASSAALACAALALDTPKTLLIVLAHSGDVDAWGHDLLSFSGQRATLFPSWETWPPETRLLDEVNSRRLRLLQQLQVEPPVHQPSLPRSCGSRAHQHTSC